jgi:dienelactone hydrolase
MNEISAVRGLFLTAAICFTAAFPCAAAEFHQEEFRIPFASGSGSYEALLVRPDEPGQYPLALINHGSPRSAADRPNMTPLSMLPEAIEFARRGWAAVVVMRRGYGGSDGGWAESFGSCNGADYLSAAKAAAYDLKTAADYLVKQRDIDGSRIISVGVSAGGFATVALTADPPPGLVAAISFAGGRGSPASNQDCRSDRLVEAFRTMGKTSRVPMLWVYAENDHFFGPRLAQQLRQAFTGSGGNVEFIRAPAFKDEGHYLFSQGGISIWSGYVDNFLKEHNLVLRTAMLPLPAPPDLRAPSALGKKGVAAFQSYLGSGPHKAFAVAHDGSFGWTSGERTSETARDDALKYCQQHSKSCEVKFIDNAPAR